MYLSEVMVFTDDLEVFHVIKSVEFYKLLQSNTSIGYVESCALEIIRKNIVFETHIISFLLKLTVSILITF